MLMKSIFNQSKLKPYDMCVDPRLKNFTNKFYIKDTCFDIFGESKGGKCEEKINFCDMCCHYHVGEKFFKQKKDCEDKCENLINGRDVKDKIGRSQKKKPKKSWRDKR